MKAPCVYIMTSRKHGPLYTGVTSDLIGRAYQHRTEATGGFSKRYNTKRLVWFERHEVMETAIAREKQIKRWLRSWKIELIEQSNPNWRDLWGDIV